MNVPVRVTRDPAVIRQWAEARNGTPALIDGRLQIAFPAPLEPAAIAPPPVDQLDWDQFFRRFEAEDLEFRFQETNIEGDLSRFNEISRAQGRRAS